MGFGYVIRVATEPDDLTPPAQVVVTPSPSPQPLDSGLEMTMTTLREETPEYSIDLAYPQLGLALDSEIQSLFDERVAKIKELAQDQPPSPLSPGPYRLTSTFHSAYIDPDIVSIQLSVYSYSGGAHGLSTTYGFNLKRESASKLTLEDALSLIGLSLSEVANQSLIQLETRLGDAVFPEGVSPESQNFQTFVVNAEEVTFIFQEYQVAPYAAGPQDVSFPRTRPLP